MLRRKKLYKSAIVESRLGFTLMELMVVIAILGVLMAITIPVLSDLTRRHASSGAVQDMLMTLRLARLSAIEENEMVAVIVDAVEDSYEAFVDDGGTDTSDSDADGIPDSLNNGVRNTGERIISKVAVPEGIGIGGGGSTTLRFNSRGFSTDASGNTMGTPTTFQLSSVSGGSHSITIYPTGHSVIN